MNPLRPLKNRNVKLEYRFKKLKTVPKSAELQHATSVDLNFNSLNSIKELSFCSNLTILMISCNFINSLNGIQKLSKLKEIYAQSNMICSIKEVKNLKHLTVLQMENNNLTSLDGIETCTNLQVLNIAYNNITSLKPLKSLNNIRELIVIKNKITSMADFKLFKMRSLRDLDLSHNDLSSGVMLQKYMKYSLTLLRLENCKLDNIRSFSMKLPKLNELVICKNKVDMLMVPVTMKMRSKRGKKSEKTKEVFKKLSYLYPRLDTLDVSNNNIAYKDEFLEQINGLSNLVVLKIEGNPICHELGIKEAVLETLPDLSVLDNHEREVKVTMEMKNELSFVDEMGLDLSLPIEKLEKQYLKKMKMKEKGKKKKKKKKKTEEELSERDLGLEMEKHGKKGEVERALNELDSKYKKISQMKKERVIPSEYQQQLKINELKNFEEVTRMYEECMRASDKVQNKIDSIIEDFSVPYEKFKQNLKDTNKKQEKKKSVTIFGDEISQRRPQTSAGIQTPKTKRKRVIHKKRKSKMKKDRPQSSRGLGSPMITGLKRPGGVGIVDEFTLGIDDLKLKKNVISYSKKKKKRKMKKKEANFIKDLLKRRKVNNQESFITLQDMDIINEVPKKSSMTSEKDNEVSTNPKFDPIRMKRYNSSQKLYKTLNLRSYKKPKKKKKKARGYRKFRLPNSDTQKTFY